MAEFKTYNEAQEHQLSEWLAGRPWHNPFAPDGSYGEETTDGECCPDFSCCSGSIFPLEMRQEFVNNPASREGFMVMGLGVMMAGEGMEVSMSDGTEIKPK